MKTKKYYYIFNLLLLIFLMPLHVLGKAFVNVKNDTIVKEFSDEVIVDPSSILDINFTTQLPSWGPINSDQFEIYTWDKNTIKRIVVVKVNPIDPDEANGFISHLQFSKLQPQKDTIHLDCKDGVRRINATREKYDVTMTDGETFTIKDYNIKVYLYIPKHIELILKSNLSRISLGDLTNKTILNLRSVRLKANNINELSLKAANSMIQINKLTDGIIQSNHCEVVSSQINNVKIVSSAFSEYKLTEVGKIDIISSKQDNYTIGTLNEIKATKSIFTNFYINSLNDQLNVSGENGDVFIENLHKDFSKININNTFSIIKIGSVGIPNFILNTNTKLTTFNLSNNIHIISEKNELGYKMGKYYKGSKNTEQSIDIECAQCEINLK